MGTPLCPVVPDFFMEAFEKKKATDMAPYKPMVYKSYVNDMFLIWPHGTDRLMDFVTLLNSLYTSLKFTTGIEKEGQ